ncbi:PREDICTED: serine protease HTRA2, mitochondrial [Trachymyrmex cornetzi]|uniref:Serine protease HTRA2, mitochondrial n=1 Tax=Trachymyrmex cornetzi TaxID=471704 RepID=A0A195EE27_9HYME|nr:PREDICTED: serine protease HTRA2, mitochondrial [Trachymyrmex cornetzi]KYN23361.1 Serine protease HTRA2, mitochondrial [Trachymyrmex cornetzi]
MASSWSLVRWTCLARASNSNISRLATFVFAKQHAGTRTFHSHQQQQQHLQHGRTIFSDGARRLLTCTAFVAATSLGYALYNWRDNIRQGIKSLIVPIPSVRAISLSDGNQKRDKFNFIADAVEVSAPAVVYIEIRDGSRVDYFSGKPILTSNGSGFIISQDGLILTNAHVVANKPHTAMKIQVRLHDGSTYSGTVEDIDLQSDLATVRINKTNLPTMKLGSSANLRPGEFVVAIGAPLNLSNTITSGIVSSVNRPSQELGINSRNMGLIQTDAAITFGNSGGPLVNLNGEAIGINSMKVTSGISFAIPIDYAKEFLKKGELRKKNKDVLHKDTPRRRYMGITMQTLTPEILNEMQQYYDYTNVRHGVLVWKVMVGSPAYIAGLKPGDIVTHANGESVLDSSNIYKILEQPGTINLQILRKGQTLYIQVDPEDV